MVEKSDFFLLICDEGAGFNENHLNRIPPLLFEITQFKRKYSDDFVRRMVVFFRATHDGNPVCETLEGTIRATLREQNKQEHNLREETYTGYDDLAAKAYGVVQRMCGGRGHKSNQSSALTLSIGFQGEDKEGILAVISEFLYSEYELNVNYVSGTTLCDHATLILSASSFEARSIELDTDVIKKSLGQSLEPYVADADITVEVYEGEFPAPQFYFELRVLDVPGILNTLCKAISELGLNIADIRQRPAPNEFRHQSEIVLWLSVKKSQGGLTETYLRTESRLRNLVGVQAISSHIVQQEAIPGASK